MKPVFHYKDQNEQTIKILRLDYPSMLGRNQRKIRRRLRQIPSLRRSKRFKGY